MMGVEEGSGFFPSPGTPEWSRLNRRRWQLIQQKVYGILSAVEAQELEWLQKVTLDAVDRACPRLPSDLRVLDELEVKLKRLAELERPA